MRFFIFISLFFSYTSLNSDAYEEGKSLYKEKACGGCHGTKLEGMNTYPFLANRQKGFLTYKLKRFRSRISDNQLQEMMIPFAMNLSDDDIEKLTTYIYNYVEEKNDHSYDDSFNQEGDGGS